MTDWKRLEHAYGSAADIPALLESLSPDSPPEIWEALISRLCHQGSVYPASFACLEHLAQIASRWKPEERVEILALAGAIVASDCVLGGRRADLMPADPVIESLRQLGIESLSRPGWDRGTFIYLLQATAAFRGDLLWGQYLDGLADGEFPGRCPACGADLYLVVGHYGFFTADREWGGESQTARILIRPVQEPTSDTERWMLEQAEKAGQLEVADWLLHLFGNTTCPACGYPFAVPEAVGMVLSSS